MLPEIAKGKYPNTIYRVSVRAIIRDKKGRVLLVREKGSDWTLPGGGMDHGEDIHACLARELYEEVLVDAPFSEKLRCVDQYFVEGKNHHQCFVICDVAIEDGFVYGRGVDADEVRFIDPSTFRRSAKRTEKWVYRWCVKTTL